MATRARRSSILWSIALAALLASAAAPSLARAQTVDTVVSRHRGGCTTAGVEGLSEQLVRTHLCMFPGAVTTFAPHAGITLTSSRVHPLSSVATRDALHAAAAGGSLQVNSAFRTLVQQYLLYHEGGCGRAATPGSSNHQSGVAVDLQNYSAALTRMRAAGCSHPYPGDDPVHFDCPGPDMRSGSILVFQHLWNANNPGDRIAEDGAYGPQTASRLGRSPATGFATDGCMVEPPRTWGAAFVAQSFPVAADPPIELRPGEELTGFIELRNTGTETWDGNTRLATTQPRDRTSLFAGPDWMSGHRVGSVGGTVPAGGTWRFDFTIRAPDAPGEHREHFGVVQEGVAWFSDPGQLGPADDQLQLRILVIEPDPMGTPDAGVVGASDAATPDTDAEIVIADGGTLAGRDAGDDGFELSGGCSCRAAGTS
ncbi:MAG: D-alanyl-D-alanine carboxypeptidase family protein, partial [Myxococcota bacterium]|nr:D-alanyl-D-alanine carboxypeptidase family protein [Myxococcota bacterium]